MRAVPHARLWMELKTPGNRQRPRRRLVDLRTGSFSFARRRQVKHTSSPLAITYPMPEDGMQWFSAPPMQIKAAHPSTLHLMVFG